jgi:hypothetical protein
MKKNQIRKSIVKALAKKMPDGQNKQPSEIKSEAIPLDKAEQMQLLDDELRDMVRSIITTVRPYVDAARIRQMFFDHTPSIPNGSRMQEVTQKARDKFNGAVQLIMGQWTDYEDRISKEEYEEIVSDELRKQVVEIEPVIKRCDPCR